MFKTSILVLAIGLANFAFANQTIDMQNSVRGTHVISTVFHNTATVKVKTGQLERYLSNAKKFDIFNQTRKEKGNIAYDAYLKQNSLTVVFNELWKDQAALDNHLKTPHMAAFFQSINFDPALYDIAVIDGVVTFNSKPDANVDYVIEQLVLDGFNSNKLNK